MVAPIKNNPFSADEHLLYFAEFTKAVQYAGGTTPHMLMAAEASRRQEDIREKLWWAGCYAFVYNFATAEVIYNSWAPGEWKYDELVDWARENWKGIKFRKERKAARSPERLATCMTTYAEFADTLQDKEWFMADYLSNEDRYQMAFDDLCDSVKYMGRYIAIRWVEVIRRVFNMNLEMPDLRVKDGEHPRKALALIYPKYEKHLMGGNSESELRISNMVVEYCKEDMYKLYGVETDYYTMQSLLCEYKQSCLGKRQYPGKSVDTALSYFDKVYEYWGEEAKSESIIYDVRKSIFPEFVLGELHGWHRVRDELGAVLVDYDYTWSDYIYDYMKTDGNFSKPVLRGTRRAILDYEGV